MKVRGVEKSRVRSATKLRRLGLLRFTVMGTFTLMLGLAILTANGTIDPIPLHSWSALRTYIVDRAKPRWLAAQRLIWPIQLTVAEEPTIPATHPTLADLWQGRAHFVVDVVNTGLPMGESDSLVLRNGTWWSYVHASDRSAGIRDSCGAPVPFPGCVVIYESHDGGRQFALHAPTCVTTCNQCPCDQGDNHIDQQQYPRVVFDGQLLHMVYEYRGMVMHRTSEDGLRWEAATFVPQTGFWATDYQPCPAGATVHEHPYTPSIAECLVGGPPGIYLDGEELYIFMGMGQNPGAIGCFRGRVDEPIAQLRACAVNPLFIGSPSYGLTTSSATANSHFDFRTISSAEVQKVGERYYMLYEGVRGPGPHDPGDTQFGLGLARSTGDHIDGAWEKFAENPLLIDLPANIGIGHADLVVTDGVTYLYTSLDGVTRSRLVLQWQ